MVKRTRLLLLALTVLALHGVHAADGQWAVPTALTDWKDESYKQRYFLEVKAPGEAGYSGFYGDGQFAVVSLPLKTVQDAAGTPRAEPILLIGEDGNVHPLNAKIV